jgi:hypothetical protein
LFIHDPHIIEVGDSAFVSWEERRGLFGPATVRVAAVAPDATLHRVATIGRMVDDAGAVIGGGAVPAWLLETSAARTLTLVTWTVSGPEIRDVVANPFTGPSFAVRIDGDAVVVGPVFDPSTEEALTSGMLRFVRRCAVRVSQETP